MTFSEFDGGIRSYFQEIGKTDLLTPAQEIELAERIQRGDSEARNHMITANLRLVVKIAQDYSGYGLPLLDLISEGNIGLMKAVERFDPNKGGKLSTYAAWWIKQSIKRALANQSKTIRLPVHMVDKISKMRRVAMSMAEELGREPTDDELSDEIGIDRAKIAQLKTASMRPASLDAPISDDDSTEFGEIVGDDNARSADDELIEKDDWSNLDRYLSVLDKRELDIIKRRYGIREFEGNGQTLEEVGVVYGVTRERIRQLQSIAERKMHRAKMKIEKESVGPSTEVRDAHSLSGGRKKKLPKVLDKKTSGFPRRNPRLQILDDTTVKVVKNDVPPTSIVVVPRVEFSQEISDKPSFDTVLGILNKYLEDTPKKIVLKSILTFGFSAARLRQELEKITLDDVYIVGTEDEWNWYVTIESLLIFAFKCDDGKKIHPSAIGQAILNLIDGKNIKEGMKKKDIFDNTPMGVAEPEEPVAEPEEPVAEPEEPVAEPEEPVAEPEEPVAEPEEPVAEPPALSSSGEHFNYFHSEDDCILARSFWGVPNVTVHHSIGEIWRYMAPYSLGKVVQILVQAKCITPEYAVKTLTQGDKAERVKPHIPSCTAEMLGVPVAEVEKLLQ